MIKSLLKKLVPSFVLSIYHLGWSFLSALFYRFPGKRIKVVGVTGTNGKTTTVRMVEKIFKEVGVKTAVLSSLEFKIGDKREENKLRMTMPGRGFIHRFLAKAAGQGCEVAVVEVTSEGIAQFRHKFAGFDTAVFTNLSPEHIESHGSFENYKRAKGELFKEAEIHVLNKEDGHFDFFDKFPAEEKYYYTRKKVEGPRGSFNVREVKADSAGVSFRVGETFFEVPLLGEFNIENSLAAVSVGLSEGVELEVMKRALGKMEGVPGRMELVISSPFSVVVDYAFTPNALKKVYRFLKEKIKGEEGRLLCVLGACGGGRDKWKRPVLGKIASTYCSRVFVTNEDPYDEDPWEIIKEVAGGAEGAEMILDRREAIKKALREAREGDVVVITGKGSEPSICVGEKKIPWDDREVVREEFQKLEK